MARQRGKVKWFNNLKGFGSIEQIEQEDGPDVFVRFSAIEVGSYKSLRGGDLVEFEIVQGKNGRPQAENVAKST